MNMSVVIVPPSIFRIKYKIWNLPCYFN